MTAEEFIAAVAADVHEGGVRDVLAQLERPSGRRPPPATVALARWYAALPAEDRQRVEQVVRLGAHAAVFGLLAVLDGVRRIDPAGGRLELTYVAPDGARALLNPPDGPEELLHDRFQGHVWEAVFGAPPA